MSLSGRRILVTGGRGFIGAALVRRLLDGDGDGDGAEVVVYDLPPRAGGARGLEAVADHPRLEIREGDVLDGASLTRAVEGCDLVYHLAAVAGVRNYHDRPVRTLEVNLLGTRNVLAAAAALTAPPRVVHFSSSEVYGPEATDAREDAATVLGPAGTLRWTYAAGKVAADHLAHAYFAERGLPTVGLRPFNVYGPGQVGEGAVHAFAVRALLGEPLPVTGDGRQRRAWCYLDDMLEAALAAAERPAAVGRVFNVGNPGAECSIAELAALVRELAGSRSPIVSTEHVGADVRLRSPEVAAARAVLGFAPAVGLREGLGRTLAWYREQGPGAWREALAFLEAGAPHRDGPEDGPEDGHGDPPGDGLS